jgi:hypothetical protein
MIFSDSGDDPLDDVAEALLIAGVQPEAIAALRDRTVRLTEKRRERAHAAVEHLRRELGDEDTMQFLAEGIPFHGQRIGQVVLRKAAHDGRKHPDSGKFTPMTEPKQTKVEGMVWTHQDDRRSIPWMLGQPTGAPDGGGSNANPDGIDSPGQGDPENFRAKTDAFLNPRGRSPRSTDINVSPVPPDAAVSQPPANYPGRS